MRARGHGSLTRRAFAILTMLLALVLVGRGHAFQALGIPVACGHPEETSASDESSHDDSQGDHHGCPSSCQRCACGHMPLVPAALEPALTRLLDSHILPDQLVSQLASGGLVPRLDRPPRAARA